MTGHKNREIPPTGRLAIVLLVTGCFVSIGRPPGWPLAARAQDIKGGSLLSASRASSSSALTKGGSLGAASRFRSNIASVQRSQRLQQQQQLQPQVSSQTNRLVESSVSIEQAPIVQQQQQQQFSEQRQTSSQLLQQQVSSNSQFESNSAIQTVEQTTDSEPAIFGSVAGTPGVDFPAYTRIPNSKFTCEGLPFETGLYADESTGCQVYHLCYQGRRESFLCGIGTVFNQAILNCDFWHSVDCSKSSQFYHLNADFGKSSSEPASNWPTQQASFSKTSSSSVSSSSSFQRPTLPVSQQTNSFSRLLESSKVSEPVVNSNSRISSSSFVSSATGGKTSPTGRQANSLSITRAYQRLAAPVRQRVQQQLEIMDSTADTKMATFAASESAQSKVSSQPVVQKQDTNEIQSDSGAWKPYFKSKTSSSVGRPQAGAAVSGRPPAPVAHAAVSAATMSSQSASELSTTSPTPVEPNQEPSFSETSERPSIPKGESTSPSTRPSPERGPNVEPDVQAALTSTTPAQESSESATSTTNPSSENQSSENPSSENPSSESAPTQSAIIEASSSTDSPQSSSSQMPRNESGDSTKPTASQVDGNATPVAGELGGGGEGGGGDGGASSGEEEAKASGQLKEPRGELEKEDQKEEESKKQSRGQTLLSPKSKRRAQQTSSVEYSGRQD